METLGKRLAEVDCRRLVDILADRLAEEQAKADAKGQVDTLAEKGTERQVNTFGGLLSVLEADAQRRHYPTGLQR